MNPGDDTSKLDPKDLKKAMLSTIKPRDVIPQQTTGHGDRAVVVDIKKNPDGTLTVKFDRKWSVHDVAKGWTAIDFEVSYWPGSVKTPQVFWTSECGKFVVCYCLGGIPRWPNRDTVERSWKMSIDSARAGHEPPVDGGAANATEEYYALYRVSDIPGLGPKAPSAVAISLWNGKCPVCGKGTYTGLFKTEHEGGGCP